MNGKDIDTHIVYDDDRVWSLELSSGMERFISSLAIRIGLMNVSNLPQSNFLAIDEGWGTMDSDCLLYTSPSPRDATLSRMPSSA